MPACVLTINGGSSSLKFALFLPGEPPRRQLSGKVERIGLADAFVTAAGAEGQPVEHHAVEAPDHGQAVNALIDWLGRGVGLGAVAAVGHRVVHGALGTASHRS
jgi:acetate kinase